MGVFLFWGNGEKIGGKKPKRRKAMKRSQQEKKELLNRKAAELIEQLLEWEDGNPRPTLTQIEDEILHLRKELGKEMAKLVLEEQGTKAQVPGPDCPRCGEEMRYKGQKRDRVESRIGALEIERGYYYCPECRTGLFPPG
jgi:hypothetical protein